MFKNITISAIIAVLASVLIAIPVAKHYASAPAASLGFGGGSNPTPTNNPNGIVLGNQLVNWVSPTQGSKLGTGAGFTIATGAATSTGYGSNKAYWCNTQSGRPVEIDKAEMFLSGTASSSMRVSIGTTTSYTALAAALANDYVDPANNQSLVNDLQVATGTVNTVISSAPQALGAATSTQVLAPNACMWWMVRTACVGTQNGAIGSVCEQATSTARGFTPIVTAATHYLP